MSNKSKLDDYFSTDNKLIIEKPKTWPKVLSLFLLVIFISGLSFLGYRYVLGKNISKEITAKSKISSTPGVDETKKTTDGPGSLSWILAKAQKNIDNRASTSDSTSSTIALPGGLYIPSPESVVNVAPKATTNPSETQNSSSQAQACLDQINARTSALVPYKQRLYDLQSQINNVEAIVRGRSHGSLVTEAQLLKQIEAERQKLVNLYNVAVSEYNTVSNQYPAC